MESRFRQDQTGFTLIEIVVAIIRLRRAEGNFQRRVVRSPISYGGIGEEVVNREIMLSHLISMS